jgi:hypothetical protein
MTQFPFGRNNEYLLPGEYVVATQLDAPYRAGSGALACVALPVSLRGFPAKLGTEFLVTLVPNRGKPLGVAASYVVRARNGLTLTIGGAVPGTVDQDRAAGDWVVFSLVEASLVEAPQLA